MKGNSAKFFCPAIAMLGVLLTGSASAETPSFNYVQFDYVLSGDTELSEGGGSAEVDLTNGYAIKGSFTVGDIFFVSGESHDLNYDDEDGDIFSASDSVIINDLSFVGAGGHMPVADMVELFAQVGLARATLANYAGNGYGFKIGARARVGLADLGLWYLSASTDTDITGNGTLDVDPDAFGVDAAFRFAPDTPELVLGYVDGSNDLSADGFDGKTDYSHFSVGVRKSF